MGQKRAAYDDARIITAFYDDSIGAAPDGTSTIELTNDQYRMLLDGQSAGKRMAVDATGSPILLDPPPLNDAQLADLKRSERDAALSATDWLVTRHQNETLAGHGTTLNAEQAGALLAYRKALRDLPRAVGWPNVELPAAPDFSTSANA